MLNYFEFAGVSSIDLGIEIEKIPNLNRPSRKFDKYNVPGRNGDIVVMQDAWDNIPQQYNIWGAGTGAKPAPAFGYTLAAWLSATGYQVLKDSYDPDCYRLASFTGAFDIENVMQKHGKSVVSFDCDPRRFLISGNNVIQITTSGTEIENPTPFTSKPLIVVHGSGAGSISCGGNTLEISSIFDGMNIDCENYDAFSAGANHNNLVSGVFPVIPGGSQTITFTGGVTSIELTPKWWSI